MNKNEKKINNCFYVFFYILYVIRYLVLIIVVNVKIVIMFFLFEKIIMFVNLKNLYFMICKLIFI